MSNQAIIKLYSRSQQGGELPYFVGKQYGSGWLRTIGRFAFPILRKLGIIAAKTARDVLEDRKPVFESLKRHTFDAGTSLFNQSGKSIKTNYKRKKSKGINKRRKLK
jgi:hypothetical protein